MIAERLTEATTKEFRKLIRCILFLAAAEPVITPRQITNKVEDMVNKAGTAENDLRSIKSEYDYGSKKKFVDVLGNIKKNNQNGLKGLEGLNNHPGAKNMETASRRSGASMTSSYRNKYNGLLNKKDGA